MTRSGHTTGSSRDDWRMPDFAGNWAVFLDVDGTLLDIAQHPDSVAVSPALRDALARALEKIEGYARQRVNVDAERNPAMAHLFIINPLAGRGADNLFSTHPNTGNRIAQLMDIARHFGRATLAPASGPWDAPGERRKGPWG